MEKQWKLADFSFLGSKITADGDCSHEIKRCLLLGRKAMTNLDSMFKYDWVFFLIYYTEYSYFLLVYPFFFMVYFVIDTLVLHGQLCESFPRMFELSFIKLCSYQPGSCKEREIT